MCKIAANPNSGMILIQSGSWSGFGWVVVLLGENFYQASKAVLIVLSIAFWITQPQAGFFR